MKKLTFLMILLTLCASLLSGCGRKTVRIDLSDYLNALYSGSDGAGKARGDFDYSGFEKALIAEAASDEFDLGKLVRFEASMVIMVSPDSGLKNGDKVTVNVSYDKDIAKAAGMTVTGSSKTLTVKGLRAAAKSSAEKSSQSAGAKPNAEEASTAATTAGPVDHCLTDISELNRAAISAMKQAAQNRAEESAAGFLEFQTDSGYTGFYNGETVTVDAVRVGDTAYTFREKGLIKAVAIPCYLHVTVQEPAWMENASAFEYDLVFLCTTEDIIVRADGSVFLGETALRSKGTADMEKALLDDLRSWYINPVVETVGFKG